MDRLNTTFYYFLSALTNASGGARTLLLRPSEKTIKTLMLWMYAQGAGFLSGWHRLGSKQEGKYLKKAYP